MSQDVDNQLSKFADRVVPIIAGVVMIGILFAVIVGFEPSRRLFCRPEEMCLREWISASGTFIGGLATFATLLYFGIQLSQARLNHLEVLRTQLLPSRNLAETAKSQATAIAIFCVKLEREVADGKSTSAGKSPILDETMIAISELSKRFHSSDLTDFERQIGGGGGSVLADLRIIIDSQKELASRIVQRASGREMRSFEINEALLLLTEPLSPLRDYSVKVMESAARFIEQYDRMAGLKE